MQGEKAIRVMAHDLYREGVAAFCPTTMSAPPEDTGIAIRGIMSSMNRPELRSSRVLGAHLEAPFLQANRCGAQRKEFFTTPSMDKLLEMTSHQLQAVRLITLAPELPDSEAFVRSAAAAGIRISLGHTDATAEQVHSAADWGADHITHTFNAQTPIHHRNPGVPGAALTDDRFYCEMICDGVHLHEDIVRLIVRCKGPSHAVAITDAMEAAGMPDGEYSLGGQAVYLRAGEARLADGTLAGSVLTMHAALENLIHRFSIDPVVAAAVCTAAPADSVGAKDCGRILPGQPAPLNRFSRDWRWLGVLG